ncbi:MAG TPA: shikimate kinase [Acidimicrobiia bacterium]|nr:shikimate kinase [Acidimicrobiia bacterium]
MSRGQPHLILVGMMGTGKSVVGRVCSEKLGWPFVDTDMVIEHEQGRTIAELFESEGEAAFRSLEAETISALMREPAPMVVACGGGAVLDANTRNLFKKAGFVVWLTATPADLAARIGRTSSRPLLVGRDATAVLADLVTARRGAYEEVADVVVDTSGREVKQVADDVLEAVGPMVSGRSS